MRGPSSSAKVFAAAAATALVGVAVVASGDATVPTGEVTPAPRERALRVRRAGPAPRPSDAVWKRRCRRAHPLAPPTTAAGMDPEAIRDALRPRREAPSLGSATIGAPTRGALFNGVQLQEQEGLRLRSPHLSWGTESTVRSIERAVAEVRCRYPDAPPLAVGNVSRQRGGGLRSHRSHQSGLDVDLGFYYRHGYDWYLEATEDNFDRERTWALIEALLAMGNVEYVFVDRRIEAWLEEAAVDAGLDEARRATIFDGTHTVPAIVLHARGHDDHLHVRFVDEAATENAARLLPFLWGHYRALAGW